MDLSSSSKLDLITEKIIGCAIEVHRVLGGPGLLESVYEEAFCHELDRAGLAVERQKQLPIVYKAKRLSTPLRIDVLVEGQVIVECKSTADYNKIYEVQLLTYLRLSALRVGLVINFGEILLKNGVHRVVNPRVPAATSLLSSQSLRQEESIL